MDPNFWPDAFRDLGLLLAGGLLTVVGAGLSARRERKIRKEDRDTAMADASDERNRASTESLRRGILSLYTTVSEDQSRGKQRVVIPRDELLDAENAASLLHDTAVRIAIVDALSTLNGLGVPIDRGELEGPAIKLQSAVLYSTLEVLNAIMRGDTPPAAHVAQLSRIGDATRRAWTEAVDEANP